MANSLGGAFDINADYLIGGQWTFTQDPYFGSSAAALVTTAGVQTLTNKTLTAPTVSTGTFTSPTFVTPVLGTPSSGTLTGMIYPDTVFCTGAFSQATSATLAAVTGLVVTVVPGTYRFYINLSGTAGASGGIKAAFKYTTTALTSLEATGRAFTASAVVVQHTTTTTDETSLIASTTAAISTVIEGRMVVSTGGTVQLEAAQNASDGTATTIAVGSSMTFTRIS